MRIESDRLETDYPPANKCEVNSKHCDFEPVDYICHECGKQLCGECAVGVVHQPQLVTYEYDGDDKQVHCPDCADGHSLRLPVVGGGAAAIVLGLIIAGVLLEPVPIVIGLLFLVVGAYFVRREFNLKKNREMPKA